MVYSLLVLRHHISFMIPGYKSFAMTTMTYRESLANFARMCGGLYAKDLAVLTDEQYTTSPMGKARTAQDFTAETIQMNNRLAAMLTSGAPQGMPTEEESNAAMAEIPGPQEAAAAIASSAGRLADAIVNCPEENLALKLPMPWGEETFLSMAILGTAHVMYHDAQVNYLQSLHGDDQIHWM